MAKQKADIRQKIIDATIGLMKEHGDASLITMRDIAAKAGTGVGLINYHFQTKENLISICSLELIGSAIAQMQSIDQGLQMNPVDRLFRLSKGIAEFMVMNEGIARISIPSGRNSSCMSRAQATARPGPSNVAKKPSPAVSTSRPR